MRQFDTAQVTRLLTVKAAEVPEIGKAGALLANPAKSARFPVCVIQPPLARPKYSGAACDLSITIEVWAKDQYGAMETFGKVQEKLAELNLQCTNNTPLFMDAVTEKWRFGGYFECRWNALTNSFEMNR